MNFTVPQTIQAHLGRYFNQHRDIYIDHIVQSTNEIADDKSGDAFITIDLVKSVPSDKLVVTNHDPLLKRYIGDTATLLLRSRAPDYLGNVLADVANFFFHLHRMPTPKYAASWDIAVKLQRARGTGAPSSPEAEVIDPTPTDKYLAAQPTTVESMARGGSTTLREGKFPYHRQDRYYLELENNSECDLYVWAFIFDGRDFTIRVHLAASVFHSGPLTPPRTDMLRWSRE